jgi:large subunit ribosomal protein L21
MTESITGVLSARRPQDALPTKDFFRGKLSLAGFLEVWQPPRPFPNERTAMSYAIFKTGGKQYRVAEGDVIDIEKLDLEPGKDATFSEVLFIGAGDSIKTAGDLKGASIVAEVIDQVKAAKVVAFKYRRRKGYHRTVGHRQKLTRVKIKSIAA